ncbi:unnamed protein product [Ilex paraguariensis]|uniref:E3 ubiquitin-protein ligase LIN n=1 Tax=Ilex paraguariensis TaxID=185542 RepID=A0ABC8RWV4_9AQUA
MASLQELLAEEGFVGKKFLKSQKKVRFRDRIAPQESVALPIYICHDRKSLDFSKQKIEKAFSRNGSSVFSSRSNSEFGRTNLRSVSEGASRNDEPAIDEVAIRAVVSILSGYVGQYLRDEKFRENVREKCFSCFVRRRKDSGNGIFTNFELGVESIEKLVENRSTKKELRIIALRNSITLLSIVASLDSKGSKNGSTSGTPNSHLSACAQLYLSIVYKLEKKDRISARHLLQVFCDAPFIARTHLLPELWEHFFLPHLLHINVWYSKELEFLSNSDYADRERRMKDLNNVYNDQIDCGTIQFALYYKEWLKVGVQAPPVPAVPLPSKLSYGSERRKSSDSFTSHSSINRSLYSAVFSPMFERRSMDLDARAGASINSWGLEEEEKVCMEENNIKQHGYLERKTGAHRRSSNQNYRDRKAEFRPEIQKSDYFQFLTCRSEPAGCLVHSNHTPSTIEKTENTSILPSRNLREAINTICCSDSLTDCERAIRVITKVWIYSHGDPIIETTLSKKQVIEGMLEVLFASNDDEILELAISILAELVTRKEMNGQIILNSDPQLDIFMRLLRSSSLFLKAAALLYLVKPKAKQMISIEWVPLVLRVLEFGDQLQTLFTFQCSPQVAAYYFLDQLLEGFDEDKNLENARQVVLLGGLRLLVRRIEAGDISEKNKAVTAIYCCIRADGRCRHFIANNLNKDSVISLLVLGKQVDYPGQTLALLTELLCLQRYTERTKFLNGLISGWGSLNTMHILLVYLRKAKLEERPMVAAILLQLDLLGDPLKCSVYREEAVEAIVASLDCQICNEKVQEQSARALLMLGGRFSYTGEPEAEKWILKEAGFDESSGHSFNGKDIVTDRFVHNEEEDAMENWQRKAAIVLLTSGNNSFLAALSDSIANGIPCLTRASIVTVSWMSRFLLQIGDDNLHFVACSILVPGLIESLNYDKSLEERILASFSLFNLIKNSEYVPKISPVDEEFMAHLRNLSQVTWTASELISMITSPSSRKYPDLDSEDS